jgi:hypothetical protein
MLMTAAGHQERIDFARVNAAPAALRCWICWPGYSGRAVKVPVGDAVAHGRELQRLVDKRWPKVQFVSKRGAAA